MLFFALVQFLLIHNSSQARQLGNAFSEVIIFCKKLKLKKLLSIEVII